MLLTQTYYERITGDTTADDPNVWASAASAAQDLLEDALDRIGYLELGEHVETLEMDSRGYVYPTATPLIDADGGWLVYDDSLHGGTVDLGTFVALLGTEYPERTEVTYRGGYSADTAPAYLLRDLCAATHALLHPVDVTTASSTPANAKAVSVGDVSVTFDTGGGGGSADLLASVTWSAETMKLRRVPAP